MLRGRGKPKAEIARFRGSPQKTLQSHIKPYAKNKLASIHKPLLTGDHFHSGVGSVQNFSHI